MCQVMALALFARMRGRLGIGHRASSIEHRASDFAPVTSTASIENLWYSILRLVRAAGILRSAGTVGTEEITGTAGTSEIAKESPGSHVPEHRYIWHLHYV